MKPHLILFLGLIMLKSPGLDLSRINSFQETPNFDWIVGDWVRVNSKEELITTETWKKTSDSLYIGTGLTRKNNETVFRENLRLIKKDKNWVYEVTGVNADTTNFILTSISTNAFTAVNEENPFPKQINYRSENGNLIAEISDNEKKIVFEFKKTHQK